MIYVNVCSKVFNECVSTTEDESDLSRVSKNFSFEGVYLSHVTVEDFMYVTGLTCSRGKPECKGMKLS
jgi:hypothetical protein